jgi:Ca2+-binding RTX toxin-like protein
MATITGTSGDDTLNGTSSADKIYGLDGNDTLYGNGGSDQLDGGAGADTMSGGTGNDIYFVDDSGDVVIENSGEGTDEVRTTLAAYALGADVEKLKFTGSGAFSGTGNALNNDITGGASDDTIDGGDGYDFLSGGGGNDTIYGGAGHDTITGGSGDDHMEGGADNDAYIVDSTGDVVVEGSGGGYDEVFTALSVYTMPSGVEKISYNGTSGGSYSVTGNALDNLIYGSGAADTLSGMDGADEIRAAAGNDTLSGGDGADLLVGGAGADGFTGGSGNDTFRIGYYETGFLADADTIADFASGDLIDVAGWDANTGVAGDQAFTFVGTAAFSGNAGELRSWFDGTDTWVMGDITGDGVGDFEIRVAGNVSLGASDFVL